jgi:CBS-domain-containing membrane protein
MTSPAVTLRPDAPLDAAARLLNAHHIRQLPVVDDAGSLVGVDGRRDLLEVFIRPDAEIEAEVRDVLADILLESSAGSTVSVWAGAVELTGTLPDKGLVTAAARLTSEVSGVVAVTNHLAAQAPVMGAN